MKRTLAMITAGLMMAALSAPITPASADNSYDLTVTVDTTGYRKPISPYIYGINYIRRGEAPNVTTFSARQGGNRHSAYNWENNASSAGADYKHYSDAYLVNFDKASLAIPGANALEFAEDMAAQNTDYKITTVQMAGYAAADTDGEVTADEIAPSARWIPVYPQKNAPFFMTPDTTDNAVYMDEYVNYLVTKLGDSATKTGIQAYSLDNEPTLWSSTHARMHPVQTTCEEIVSKSIEYASAIKSVDPGADVYGGVLYGFNAYKSFSNAPDWEKIGAGYNWFISYYLDQMAKAEQTNGKRLVDVLDLHYYSEAKGTDRVTACKDHTHTDCIDARLQAPRSLWDATYTENSWIGQYNEKYLPILPHVQDSIDTYYPGTKISFTEYSFGGGDHISGAIAEADTLGIFAKYGVYMASGWAVSADESYIHAAMELYTDYDGKGAKFGDTLVQTNTADIEKSSAYAAIRGMDESKLNVVLMNKSRTEAQNANIQIKSGANYDTAKVYGITSDSPEIRLLQTVTGINNNEFTLELPALSVVQIELSAADYTMQGDVNMDGTVDIADVRLLQDWLLAKPGVTLKNWKAVDLCEDDKLDVFDLCLLKRMLLNWWTETIMPTEISFTETKTGQWKLRNGMEEKTLQCCFSGTPGNTIDMVYGYWDPVAINESTGESGKWFNNEDTKLGECTFDEDGETVITFTVPANAMNVELITLNHTAMQNGQKVQLDKDGFFLEKVVIVQE